MFPTLSAVLFVLFFSVFNAVSQNIDSLNQLATTSTSLDIKSDAYLQLGIIHYKQGNFNVAEGFLSKAIDIAAKNNNYSVLLKAYNNKGNILADKGENTQALVQYQKAIKVAEKTNNLQYIAHINKNIGALFVSLKRFNESLAYYYKAENAAIKFKDTLLFADCNNNIGTVFEQLNNYQKAAERYTLALNIYLKHNDLEGVSMAYSNLAIVSKLQKKYNQAIEYNLKSLTISEKLNDQWAQAATLNNIGNLYGEIGNYTFAKEFCNKSLLLSQKIKAPEITNMVYESLADAAFKAKDFKAAYTYQKQFMLAKDSFANTEINNKLSELKVKYEAEKKEKENQQLKFDNELKKTELSQTTLQRNWTGLISILIITLILTAFLLNKKAQAAKNKLQQLHLINQTTFETEQNERNRIASDLHDGVGQKLAVVKMQLSLKNSESVEKANQLVDEAIADVRSASHNLFPNDLNKGLFVAVEEMVDQINYTSTKTKIDLNISSTLKNQSLSKQTALYVYRIIQEVTTNAFKYAKAENIYINMDCDKNNLHLDLNDNGIGMDAAQRNHAKGIGLKSIHNRVEQLKGSVQIQSQPNKGTQFKICIPL